VDVAHLKAMERGEVSPKLLLMPLWAAMGVRE
jgi:hypothetical protein